MPEEDKPVAALTEDQRVRLEELLQGWIATRLNWLERSLLIVIALLVHLARSRVMVAAA